MRFDLLNARLFVGPEEVRLTPLETRFLAFLALDPGGGSREELCEQLFAHLGDGARNALKVLVHRVREKIGRHSVVRYSEGRYSLDHNPIDELRCVERDVFSESDSPVLEDDCRARLLWYRARLKEPRRGALLKQQWFELVEWRLKQLEHGVAVRLGRDALARGDGRAAAEFAAQLVAAGALDEDATEIYMRALISLGRRQAALAYYDQYVEALSREFGVGPSEGLRRFAASLAS